MRKMLLAVSGAVAVLISSSSAAALAVPAHPFHPARPDRPSYEGMGVDSASIIPAGDLNGDKVPDVLDVREPLQSANPAQWGITARNGRTGKELWHHFVPNTDTSFVQVMPARLGPRGKPAVLVVDQNYTGDPGGDQTDLLDLRALSGRSGATIWHRTIQGSSAAGTGSNYPDAVGLIHDAKGPDQDLLVERDSINATSTPYLLRTDVVSGTNGTVHQRGPALTSPTAMPVLAIAGDFNGDGLDDIAVAVPGSVGGTVIAEQGKTGHVLWRRNIAAMGTERPTLLAIGHFSGPHHGDLALTVPQLDEQPPLNTVINGKNGHILWSRHAGQVYVLDRAGPHLVPALGLLTDTFDSQTSSQTDGVSYLAVNVHNKVIYQNSVNVVASGPPGSTGGGGGQTVTPLGDVQADGSEEQRLDLNAELAYPSSSVNADKVGYVDGRTGKFHAVPIDVPTDGSLRHGSTTDLLSSTLSSGHVMLTARRGSTRKAYYTRTLSGLSAVQDVTLGGLRVSGKGCSDISVVTVNGTSGNTAGMLTATGKWLWKISFDDAQVTGGSLQHHPVPKHACV